MIRNSAVILILCLFACGSLDPIEIKPQEKKGCGGWGKPCKTPVIECFENAKGDVKFILIIGDTEYKCIQRGTRDAETETHN